MEALKTSELVGNSYLLTLFTVSVALLIGCFIVWLWRRSSTNKSVHELEPMKIVVSTRKKEPAVDDGEKKVAIFFSTQTGTVEGFTKALLEEAKVRYEKASLKAIDWDDYAADNVDA